jgi:Domain of unknown function (DUF4355)
MSEDAGAAGTDPGTEEVPDDIVDSATEDNNGAAGGSDTEPDLAAEAAKWRELARKHERRAKENSDAAKELAEIKQAGMSEQEKLNAQLAVVTRERDEARADHARIMAAAAADLPVELIDDLGSGTDEEISERAGRFARVIEAEVQKRVEALTGQVSRNGNQAARPVESMRAGSAPASGDTPSTPDQWFRQLLQNR